MSGADHGGRTDDGDEGGGAPGDGRGVGGLDVRRDEFTPPGAGAAVPRVRAAGELDAATAPRLHEALTDAIPEVPAAAGSEGMVLVDLDAVGFCDSRGLSTLVAATRAAARAGSSLRLVANDGSAVARLLVRTGMTGLLPLHADVATALTAVAPSPLEQDANAHRPGGSPGTIGPASDPVG